MRPIFLVSIPLGLALVSCAKLVPTLSQSKGKPATPGSWAAASSGSHGKISTGWLEDFQSKEMTALVMEAVENNPDLNASAARLRAARHSTVSATADLLPSITASSSGSRAQSGNGADPSTYSENYSLSLNTSWEPDIWGRLRDLRTATHASYQASVEDYRAARLSLAANTARAWCNLVTADHQLTLAEETLESFLKNNAIVERNYKAGVPGTRAIAVQLSRNNVASARRSLSSRRQQRDEASRALEQLLGRYPAAKIHSNKTLPSLSSSTPSSIPATLLSRRPDLAAAQLRILQSAKSADASVKNLLPNVSLRASSSSSESNLRHVFNPSYLASSIAASLTQTIYRGGALRANAQAALEQNRASIHDFADLTIRAFREVEDALAAEASLREQEAFLLVEVRQATLAERSAEQDYSEGIEDSGILEILESQRRANNARASLIALRNQRLQNRIDLHLALGGDFVTPAPAAIAKPKS